MANLYLICQDKNTDYDTYDSAVVCAQCEEQASMMHPDGSKLWDGDKEVWYILSRSIFINKYIQIGKPGEKIYGDTTWASPADVTVKLIGIANDDLPIGVVTASFNAG